MQPKRINVLGVAVSAINMDLALAVIDEWVENRSPNYVCVTGVHGVMESQTSPELRSIHNRAGLVTPDGMPLVWVGRAKGYRDMHRVYGPDLMLAMCEHSHKNQIRHYFYGGAEGIPQLLAQKLQERYPHLIIAGTYSPPFRPLTPEEDAQVVDMINASNPDLVWVGLSTPKQERWMASHVGTLTAPVLLGVGAAFDFHAGTKKQAPFWMQRSGLEWFFRLLSEPTRLWKRYLYNNPRFVWHVALQFLGLRKYPLDET